MILLGTVDSKYIMIQKVRKGTSFLLSVLITGILGTIGGYLSANYSKEGSLLVSVARADVPHIDSFSFGGDGGGDGAGAGDGGGDGACSGSSGDCGGD